jgi:hypothetical protein
MRKMKNSRKEQGRKQTRQQIVPVTTQQQSFTRSTVQFSKQTLNSHSDLFAEGLQLFAEVSTDQDYDQAVSLLYAAFKQGDERAIQFFYEALKDEDEKIISALYRLKEKNPSNEGVRLLFYYCAARYYAEHFSPELKSSPEAGCDERG